MRWPRPRCSKSGDRHLQGVIQRPSPVPGSSSLQSSPCLFCLLDPAPGDLCIVGKSSLQAFSTSPEIPASLSETPETSRGGGYKESQTHPPAPGREAPRAGAVSWPLRTVSWPLYIVRTPRGFSGWGLAIRSPETLSLSFIQGGSCGKGLEDWFPSQHSLLDQGLDLLLQRVLGGI